MWTNIFKIGELQTISWFQFLPNELDSTATYERSSKAEQKDALNSIVLSAYLHLQSDCFLSTWTNSFIGPWDPSQGEHNPDEKIKLWLFLPGRHSVVSETAQPAVNKLRVVSNGLWVAPGNSEEVAAALTQALRNCLERTLRGLSYARFGDVFTKYNPPTKNQNSFRRAQPTVEFVFAATEEAIFVHVIISARYMRNLCSDDIEKVLSHSPRSNGEGLPVVVAPSGMLGRLVGCCPSDLVRQVYSSKSSVPTLPGFTQPTMCQLRGQSYYVEVALGFPAASADKFSDLENKHIRKELDSVKDPQSVEDGQKKLESPDSLPVLERTFIYPPEAILVPMVHQAFVRFSSQRIWLQSWLGSSSWEAWPFWNFPPSSYFQNRQFWYYFLRRIGLANLAPQPSDNDFEEWWNRVASSVGCNVKKGLNTLIILGAWQIWKHRNDCVFNGASPNLSAILIVAGEEARLWSLAGAKGLTPVVDAAG